MPEPTTRVEKCVLFNRGLDELNPGVLLRLFLHALTSFGGAAVKKELHYQVSVREAAR